MNFYEEICDTLNLLETMNFYKIQGIVGKKGLKSPDSYITNFSDSTDTNSS